MALKMKRIPDDILAVLSSAEVDGNVVRLTCGQLDPKAYRAVNDVLVNLGGKWKTKVGHVFAEDPTAKLDAVILSGEIAPANLSGYFPTPKPVVDVLLPWLDLRPGIEVLEPSAGEGALALAARDLGAWVTCCELDPERARVLRGLGFDVFEGDFLANEPGLRSFDRVLMNPPFAGQQDVAHVRHAWEFLRPGGRLVSVMAVGFTFRQDNKSAAFRAFVDDYGEWGYLPEDAFKASGTGVHTAYVVLYKPEWSL